MEVTNVVYYAEDQASLIADSIRLVLTLKKMGVDMKTETFEGDSNAMNARAWLMEAEYERVDADEIVVEAFNLTTPRHVIAVNGERFEVPLTGPNNTQTFKFGLP